MHSDDGFFDEEVTVKVLIEKNSGEKTGPFKAVFSPDDDAVFVEFKSNLEKGDKILRELPNDQYEHHLVKECRFQNYDEDLYEATTEVITETA